VRSAAFVDLRRLSAELRSTLIGCRRKHDEDEPDNIRNSDEIATVTEDLRRKGCRSCTTGTWAR
jgi:hypothetical protein